MENVFMQDIQVCDDMRTVQLGRYAASDLHCQLHLGHKGKHKVSRWFGDVFMTAEWGTYD